ncbi:T9SS type A sorting domain-containing protein [Pontibacter sp. G13]|uniref:T9SS type A sorting domain-containing protein n=1 Tax=Pontibacter sp. G13 TaxID=3074898 RepID=UPI00288B3BBC|nr:T9SS type A sorting domain-containing protein [Pontibacter sp. G13]WNJ18691.1 alpha/beta fold hydrolase [Pontibacter sp. G13]
MSNRYLAFFLAWLLMPVFHTFGQSRGDLVSSQLIQSLSTAAVQSTLSANGFPPFIFPAEYPVDIYKVVYRTPAATGDSLTLASGLVLVPGDSCNLPEMIYNHGTLFYTMTLSDLMGDWFVGLSFATEGYLTIMPDYLGQGETPLAHAHPFVHSETEASAVVDMIRASRVLADDTLGLVRNGQSFMFGYSQGGHVSMAALRSMQEEFPNEFHMDFTVAGSGPYDVSGITRDSLLFGTPSLNSSFFLTYVMMGYQYVYGNIWDQDPSEAFVAPYDSLVPLAYDRNAPFIGPLPLDPTVMLQPDFLADVIADSTHPVNVALADNDLYDWAPQTPVRLIYCEADEEIPYQNATFTRDTMLTLGASDIIAESQGANNNHFDCAGPSIIYAKLRFAGLKATCNALSNEDPLANSLEVYPNPFADKLKINLATIPYSTSGTLNLMDLDGRLIRQEKLESHNSTVSWDLAELPSGIYLVQLLTNNGSYRQTVLKM